MANMNRLGTTATTVTNFDGKTLVAYHNTVVVAFNDKEIALDNGGWITPTTVTRMNQASNQFGLGFEVRIRSRNMEVYHTPSIGWVPFLNRVCFYRD